MVIQVIHLKKNFGKKEVLKGISFEVPRGEIFGYLGPNGSGKTTTLRILAGIMRPTSGEVYINGMDVTKNPFLVKKNIGYVPESGALYEHLSPREYLLFLSELNETSGNIRIRIDDYLSQMGLGAVLDEPMSSFSRGMKQKVLLIPAFLFDPPVLLLDEPLTALDVEAVLLVKKWIAQKAEEGKAILFSSHLLEIVEKLCHRVGILYQGVLVGLGMVDELEKMTRSSHLEEVFQILIRESREASTGVGQILG
ncbi:MAG: ABC transporter ATP-binding protein [bacterium JZ-2024 1]